MSVLKNCKKGLDVVLVYLILLGVKSMVEVLRAYSSWDLN